MKRHHQGSRQFFKPLTGAAVCALALHLTACGNDPAKVSGLDGVRDNFYVGFHENKFSFPEEEYPRVPGSTLYYMLMTDSNSPTKESRAYAIDCRGKNVSDVAAVFGADASNPFPGNDTYEFLEEHYKISEQPILRCSSVLPSAGNTAIQKVFQLVDDRPDDKKKEKPLPQLFVRFNNVTADDATSQEQLYSIGCRNILNSFGTAGQKSLAEAVPILASSAASIFPDFDSYRPLNCMTNTLDPLLNNPPKKITDLPLTTTYDLTQRQLEFYRVVDALNPARTISYLLGQGNDYNRVTCYSVGDSEIKAALNFPSTYAVYDLKSDDTRYINSLNRPELECVNIQTSDRFESRWSTVREAPSVNYFKKKDSSTLYRFGCPSAEKYFTTGLNLTQSPLDVTPDLVRYLEQTPEAGYQVVTFPCFGTGLTLDPKALTAGEIISLKMPSAPADKAWLDGHTTNSTVQQLDKKHTGGYWLVSATGENASFYLQALGTSPDLSYLACPVSGNTPKLVKLANEPNHLTKWSTFRGDGTSTARLGCRDANGRIRLLNGGGTLTSLSDESSGQDAGTNWWIEHQTFVEDPNFLAAGKIVSIFSLTSNANRWLTAYPGKPKEVGAEAKDTSAATYFQVEKRTDGRGVSLKSLNKGPGELYLDCKPELSPSGLQLAPTTTGGWFGTGFKAYKLNNAPYLLFRLACFDSTKKIANWLSISGNTPTLIDNGNANQSTMNSLLYLEVRPAAPKL